jgi:integrase
VRWTDLDVRTGACRIPGTKSAPRTESSTFRRGPLSVCRRELSAQARRRWSSQPATSESMDKPWEQANSAKAVRDLLTTAGFPWAVPHTFRRTVATLLHQQGVPINRIADQLGHKDPAMTARVYLGRDLSGDKSDLAALL